MILKLLITLSVSAVIFSVCAEKFNGTDPPEAKESHLEKEGKLLGTKEEDFLMGKVVPGSDFPPGYFTLDQLKHGAIILNFIGALYSFAVIGIVCGDYFLPSVDCICTDLNLSQDVAAATFMSFATTAPELFIILIATFLRESDIGVGAVVGSGMFNILGVATIGGLAASSPIKLDWWPLYRDSLVYMFAPISMAVVLSDGIVTFAEAAWLIIYYFLYFLIMFFNRSIRSRIKAWIKEIKKKSKKDFYQGNEAAVKTPVTIPTISLTLQPDTKDVSNAQEPVKEDDEDNDNGSFKAYFMNSEDSISLRRVSACSNASSKSNRSRRKSDRSNSLRKSTHATSAPPQAKLSDDLHTASSKHPDEPDKKEKAKGCAEEGKENEDWAPVSLFTLPTGSLWDKFTWVVLWPSTFVLSHTIPNCRSTRWRKLYPITFLMCVFWIAISSYFGTWMISVVGETFEISQSVMGLTFLALGGSMPEAISIFIMSRQGEGGLGFSNSLGGNTMDICLCLGLPWLIKCALEGPINIESEGLQYNSIALVLGVILLLSIATHTKFYMNKKMGVFCCVFYFLFIIISVLIETKVIDVETDR